MPVELLSGCLRYRRAIVSGALGSVIAASWAYLWLGGGQIMPMPPEWSVPYAALIFVMWAVMMVAMMLPGAAPTVLLVTTPCVGSHRQFQARSRHRDAVCIGLSSRLVRVQPRRYIAAMGPRRSRSVIRDDGIRQCDLGWRCIRRRRYL